MNRETRSQEVACTENLMVVEDNGRISSHRVSQVYGKALLGAMALRVNKLPFASLHESFLSQHEPLSLDRIKRAAQAVAPRDNFIFVDDGRRILSCRLNPVYGVALLESLRQTPEEVSQTQPVLSHAMDSQASETTNDQDIDDMKMDLSQQASETHHQPYANASSSQLSTSGTHANILGILSDEILSSANRQPYDRDWMNKHNINESCLTRCPSKHRLDVLVRHGALKVGDKLCVTYHPDSGPVVIVGEVLHSLKTGGLDIRIAPARADFDGILHDCKSPKEIVSGMDKAFQIQRHSKVDEAWKLVAVVAEDGRDVGSLWKVRQAYQVFTDSMAEWGARNREISP